ncbi:MAG: PAS domain-containing sensor histidine kinase, partial [Vampirovibrionia bacterium]
ILKETQIKFLAISEAAKDVIILIDSKGVVTYCNPAIEKVFGYKCTEILGKPIHKIIAPKSYHEKAKEKFDIFVRTGKGDVLNKTLELPALKKDRTELMVELSVSPLMLDNQWNAIGIIRDITHRKELEKQLEEERTNLKSTVEEKTRELKLSLKNLEYTNMFLNEANSHKTRFLQSISHELRTPLNAIIGFTQLLSQQIYGELNDTQADYINLISENSNSLLHMINNLLSITQIDAGTMEMKRENIPLDDFIRDMHKILLHKFKVKNINFTYKINSPGFMLNVDKLKLRQIIYNLLSNARKYTQDNGSVELVVDKCADKIIISVIDNGIGVREENREKIFESFFKENMNGNQLNHGAGIGLTLARRLVSMHNGQLTLDDKDGKGSKFSVHLPLEV